MFSDFMLGFFTLCFGLLLLAGAYAIYMEVQMDKDNAALSCSVSMLSTND